MKRPIKEYFRFIWARPLASIIQLPIPTILRTKLYRMKGVKIGKGSKIGYGVYMDEKYPNSIHIGNDVWIAARVVILAHKRDMSEYYYGDNSMQYPYFRKDVHIEDFVHIGANSVILPGITLCKGAIVGSGSVVTKDVAPYTVVAGNPARVLKVIEKRNESK